MLNHHDTTIQVEISFVSDFVNWRLSSVADALNFDSMDLRQAVEQIEPNRNDH